MVESSSAVRVLFWRVVLKERAYGENVGVATMDDIREAVHIPKSDH